MSIPAVGLAPRRRRAQDAVESLLGALRGTPTLPIYLADRTVRHRVSDVVYITDLNVDGYRLPIRSGVSTDGPAYDFVMSTAGGLFTLHHPATRSRVHQRPRGSGLVVDRTSWGVADVIVGHCWETAAGCLPMGDDDIAAIVRGATDFATRWTRDDPFAH